MTAPVFQISLETDHLYIDDEALYVEAEKIRQEHINKGIKELPLGKHSPEEFLQALEQIRFKAKVEAQKYIQDKFTERS